MAMFAVIVAAGCAGSSDEQTASTTQESRDTFVNLVTTVLGFNTGAGLLGYGCYCGPDNDVGVIPIDAVDQCCMNHDYAWMDAVNLGATCNCNTRPYAWSQRGADLFCNPDTDLCATYCCERDLDFVRCVRGAGPLNPANQRYNRTQCQPIECVSDDDCEPSTWCSGYRCVPMCGGGIGFATADHCQIDTATAANASAL